LRNGLIDIPLLQLIASSKAAGLARTVRRCQQAPEPGLGRVHPRLPHTCRNRLRPGLRLLEM